MTQLITNARLADGRVVDVKVNDGRITEVAAVIDRESDVDQLESVVVDVEGWLLLPAMAEAHAHLDKALTAEHVPNPTGDLPGAIDAWTAASEAGVFTHDDMVRRIRAALELLLLNGVTAVRSHINCGAGAGISNLIAAQDAVVPFADLMEVEFVALTHTPIVGEGSEVNRQALDDALAAGVHLVGGCPHLEDDGPASIDVALRSAIAGGVGIDLHVDETIDATVLTLRELARQVIDVGFDGRIAASHCVSLGVQPPDVQTAVAREVSEAGITVISLPQTNLFLQGRGHRTSMPRGLTALAALLEEGVLVAAGADNVQDPFNLVGRSDPLETASLLVMAGHILPDDAYDMVSNNVRRALGLPTIRFEIGDPADFVAIDAPSIRGAIADAPVNRKVFKGGRLVASSAATRTIHR